MLSDLFANPVRLLLLCGIIALVLSLNMALLGLLRGNRGEQRRISTWGKAFGGGLRARQQQAADLDALRQAVKDLQASAPPEDANDQ